MALEAAVMIQKKGFEITAQDFYNYPTISGLAKLKKKNLNEKQSKKIIPEIKENPTKFEKRNIENVILTGATGFLGIHILEKLSNENIEILCIARNKNNKSAVERISELFNFYFKKKLPNSVNVIETNDNDSSFGIEKISLLDLKNVKHFIHCAANVKQIGKWSDFERDNLLFTDQIAKFCLNNDIELHYISTMGIGITEKKVFDEYSLPEHVNLNQNPYFFSKHKAEEIIRKTQSLKWTIYRVGNLTGRYSDGFCQMNSNENLFTNFIGWILKQENIPQRLANSCMEFSPVDLVAEAVVDLIKFKDTENKTFHVFNPNRVKITDFFKYLNKKINILSDVEYNKKMQNNLLSLSTVDYFANFSDNSNNFNNNLTMKYLNEVNFKWTKISKSYISKMVKID